MQNVQAARHSPTTDFHIIYNLGTPPPQILNPPLVGRAGQVCGLSVCVSFGDRCLSFYTFSFGHCIVCSTSIYDSDYLPLVSSNSSSSMFMREWSFCVGIIFFIVGLYLNSIRRFSCQEGGVLVSHH